MSVRRLGPLLGLALLVGSFATQAIYANSAATAGAGVLVLSGGVTGSIELGPANCTIGPGESVSVYATNVGGWGSLFFSATDPSPGKRGTAGVSLQGTGSRKNADAVDSWAWSAARNSGHVSSPSLTFTSNGKAGAIKTVLTVVRYDNARKPTPVRVAVSWRAADCKAST